MKYILPHLLTILLFCFGLSTVSVAQLAEWRLVNAVFNPADPDGAGPATGSVNFTMQIHAATTNLNNITAITTGWSWQSANALIPTTGGPGTGVIPPGCILSPSTPANVALSPEFLAAGFVYSTVNECLVLSTPQNVGANSFDRIAIGTLESNIGINITPVWINVFTVTLWTRNTVNPRGGFVIINSSFRGTPGGFSNYELSDVFANAIEANSLTYTDPLGIPSATLPTIISSFNVLCAANKSTSITWLTSQEHNTNYFEVERSVDGANWKTVNKIAAAGTSTLEKSYQVTDAAGGAAQYRLKQVDRDGRVTYSSVARTNCEGKNVYVTLYPVPAKDVVNIIVGSDKNIKTNLQVFDTKGRMVVNMPVSLTNGSNNFKIQVQGLPAGEYILKGTSVDIEISKRFTVIR